MMAQPNRLLKILLAPLVSLLWLAASPVHAHYLDIVQFLLVQQQDPEQIELVVTLPANLDPNASLMLPQSCVLSRREAGRDGDSHVVTLGIHCEDADLQQGLIQTRWGRDGGIVQMQFLDGSTSSTMVTGGRAGIALGLPDWGAAAQQLPQGFLAKAWHYLELGTVHVLIGWDHLAFVFCLAMLASGMSLLWLITAFTAGHSLSLAMSYLGLVNIPITPVEAVIALSVVFMAREVFFTPDSRLYLLSADKLPAIARTAAHSQRWRMAVTAVFGLIHGLGFASVLGDLGVSAADTVIALAFFNIGVEVGQVMFVCAVLLTLRLLSKIGNVQLLMMRAATFSVGGMGVFWTLERVIGF
jgi:hypothetical protein